jgi:hypothetical protein
MPVSIYCYTNVSLNYQTIAIRDFRFAFEKVVLPNQTIMFQALDSVLVVVCSVERMTAIYFDEFYCHELSCECGHESSCRCLAQGDE